MKHKEKKILKRRKRASVSSLICVQLDSPFFTQTLNEASLYYCFKSRISLVQTLQRVIDLYQNHRGESWEPGDSGIYFMYKHLTNLTSSPTLALPGEVALYLNFEPLGGYLVQDQLACFRIRASTLVYFMSYDLSTCFKLQKYLTLHRLVIIFVLIPMGIYLLYLSNLSTGVP